MTALPKSQGIKGAQGGWTPEKCLHQSAKLRAQKIWLGSTGPRTAEGKQKSALNACKPGHEQRRTERLQAQRVRNYVRLNRLFTETYVHARKTWADLSRADKAQIFQKFAHLKNELGNLEVQILSALELDEKNAAQTDNPSPQHPFGTQKNGNAG